LWHGRDGCSVRQTTEFGRRQAASSHRPTTLVVGLFALISGFSLFLAGTLLPGFRPVPEEGSISTTTRQAAAEFYAAEATALATGDVSRLIAAVAPSFVDHRPGETSPDRGGMVAEVAALRSERPSAILSTQALLVDDDRVLAYISMRPADAAAGFGTPTAASDDTIEVVRVAGGVVAERWSVSAAPGVWPTAVVAPTPTPEWSSSRFATATAEGMVCGASHCS
jgi:hypothetical protein